MFHKSFQSVEKRFFRTLNSFLEPLIRMGFGSPRGLKPVGAVVLETIGRKSGRTYRTPVLASEFASLLLVSTVRSSRSQWIKNLAATPETRVWVRGQSVPVTAYVVGREISHSDDMPTPTPVVKFLIERLKLFSKLTGASFAILDPYVPQVSSG